jgi:DNA-binding XRE family transcriptional regulator
MKHRHLDLPPATPARELPIAAIHDLLERGDLEDWRPLLREIEQEPDGKIARAVARLVDVYPMYGTSPLLRAWIERCRNRWDRSEAGEREVLSLAGVRLALGSTQNEVAQRLGMSQSDYSKVERRRDVRVSTLRSIARALGGTLALLLRLPDRSVELAIGDAERPELVRSPAHRR